MQPVLATVGIGLTQAVPVILLDGDADERTVWCDPCGFVVEPERSIRADVADVSERVRRQRDAEQSGESRPKRFGGGHWLLQWGLPVAAEEETIREVVSMLLSGDVAGFASGLPGGSDGPPDTIGVIDWCRLDCVGVEPVHGVE